MLVWMVLGVGENREGVIWIQSSVALDRMKGIRIVRGMGHKKVRKASIILIVVDYKMLLF